jgi:ubiquinone/menaquinone biosynthesis C-methylase UbiE
MKDTGERLIPEGHHQTLTYGEHISRYLSVTDVVKDKVVLDIASGTGYGTQLIAKTAKKVYGVDYSPEAIEYSKQNHSSDNVEFKVGDAHNIPMDDKSVDVVVSLETIEHLKDPAKFISEVKRILKKGGQFIVSTPNDDEYIEDNEFHLHEFNLNELKQLISENFKNSTFYYQGAYFSAALLEENTFTKGGRWEGRLEKTFGQPQQKAIYYLAAASDGELEKLTQTAALADIWSTKEDLERAKSQKAHNDNMNKELKKLQKIIAKLEQENKILSGELTDIKTSKGWKALTKVYTAKKNISRK